MHAAARRLFSGRYLSEVMRGVSAAEPPVAGFDLWLDAADEDTLTITSGAVEQWDDKSGNGFHFAQGTSGNRPEYGSRTMNGVVCPNFDGSNDFLSNGSYSRGGRTCVFLVVLTDTVGAGQKEMFGPQGNSNHFKINNSTLVTTSDGGFELSSGTISVSTPTVVAQQLEAATTTHWVNLSQNGASGGSNWASVGSRIGYNYLGAEGWDGLIGEIVGYQQTMDDTECQEVIAWLMAKWGIS